MYYYIVSKNKRKGEVKNEESKRKFFYWLTISNFLYIMVFANIFKDDNKKTSKNTNNSNTSSESYVEELGDGIVINKSRELNESKEVNGFTISNIQLTTKDGMTTLLADVKNDTGAKTTLKTAEITLLDNNNEELVTVKGIINEMEAGGTSKLNISMTSNYINAYDFKVVIK